MPSRRSWAALLLMFACLAGCGSAPSDERVAPHAEVCRNLAPGDVAATSNDSPIVDCTQPHTAQTFLVGTFPASVKDRAHDAGAYVFGVCNPGFENYIGINDTLALRVQLSWAWFGPSDAGWAKGARWFRCDVVGGPPGAKKFVPLPKSAKGIFSTGSADFQGPPPDQWLTCATGHDFATRQLVACSSPHDWRAVTTVKVGQPDEAYPGDHVSEVRAHNYCSDAVSAWLGYATDYDFGYTWFHEAEWKTGNRRAICWARTAK